MTHLGQILGTKIDMEDIQMDPNQDPFDIYEQSQNKLVDSIDIEAKKLEMKSHQSDIDACLQRLQPMKDFYEKFTVNNNETDKEMERMNVRLAEMDQVLQERKEIDSILTKDIRKVMISNETINVLINNDVDLEWIGKLRELEMKQLELFTLDEKDIELVTILKDCFYQLENKCIEKIRSFLINQIKLLRLVDSEADDIQKDLLPMSPMMLLLKRRVPDLAQQLQKAYLYTIRWNYYYNVVKYTSLLEQLKRFEHIDCINLSGNMNGYLITIPGRIDQLNQPVLQIPLQIIESSNIDMKFQVEQLIQSLNEQIWKFYQNEVIFLMGFFQLKNDELIQSLKLVFSPLFKISTGFTNWVIDDSTNFDYFGMLIVIKRLHQLKENAKSATATTSNDDILDSFVDNQLLEIWPKFQKIIDQLCLNITTHFSSSSLIKEVSMAKTLLIPMKIVQMVGNIMVHLISLLPTAESNSNSEDSDVTMGPLISSLQRISLVLERGLVQISKRLSEDKQKLFLYVNFDLVWNVLSVTDDDEKSQQKETSNIAADIREHYKKLVEVYNESPGTRS